MALENVFLLSWNQAVVAAFFSNLEKYQLQKLLALSNSADKLIPKRYLTEEGALWQTTAQRHPVQTKICKYVGLLKMCF